MLADVALFSAGVAMLLVGAWVLVTGGSRLAAAFGVPSVLVGLTVVAWGTSAPELVVSLTAAFKGQPDIMLGNVMGSNIANIGLILGIGVLLLKMPGDWSLWRLEMPVLLIGTLLFCAFAYDGELSQIDGAVLMLLFAFVTVRSIAQGLKQSNKERSKDRNGRGIMVGLVLTAVGAGGLILGGQWIVESASNIARQLGASELVIGLTLVAVGTSLPELAASLMAAARRESGIALGNVVGSNLFNLLAVGGPVALFKGVPVPSEIFRREVPSLLVMTLALALVLIYRGRIPRLVGVALLVIYTASVIWWIT